MQSVYDSVLAENVGFITPPSLLEITESPNHVSPSFNREWGVPISRDKATALFVQRQVRNAFISGDPLVYDPPETTSPAVNGELKRFIVSLAAYYDSSNPIMPFEFLVEGILDFEFASFLKKIRVKQIVTSLAVAGEFLDDEDWTDIPTFQPFFDVGDVFNYGYWFFWEEPDPHDEDYCFLDVKPISEEILNELEEICVQMLPDSPEPVSKLDVLYQVTSSTALTPDLNSSKVWKEREKPSATSFYNKAIVGKKAYVQKKPCDSRCALVTPISVSNTIRYVEKQLSNIVSKMTYFGSIYVKDPVEFDQIKDKFSKKWSWFLCRDIEKDGLTKPRQLLIPIINALKRRYRRVFDISTLDIFLNFHIQIDGKLKKPPRGVGLGMSAALTTILQTVVFQWTIQRLQQRIADWNFRAGCLVYHDDFVAGFKDKESYEEFDFEEDEVFKILQLRRKKKKSWAGHNFVICESYSSPKMNEKQSYQLRLCYLPFACTNIVQAKVMFSQIIRHQINVNYSDILKKLVSYWGYEFFKDECHFPSEFGGWIPFLFRDVNLMLTSWDFSKSDVLSRAYEASKNSLLKGKKLKQSNTLFVNPLEHISKVSLESLPDFLKDHYMIGKTRTQVSSKMQRFNRPYAQFNGWTRLYIERNRVFMQTKPTSYAHVSNDARSSNQSIDFLSHPSMISTDWIQWDSSMVVKGSSPLLHSAHSQLALINWHCLGAFPGIVPCPVDPYTVPVSGYPSGKNLRLRYLQKDFEDPINSGLQNQQDYYFSEHYIDIKNSGWSNPTSVALFYWDRFGIMRVPKNPGPIAQTMVDFENSKWYMILSHPSAVQIQAAFLRFPKQVEELFSYCESHEDLTMAFEIFLSDAMQLQEKKETGRRVAEMDPADALPPPKPDYKENLSSLIAGFEFPQEVQDSPEPSEESETSMDNESSDSEQIEATPNIFLDFDEETAFYENPGLVLTSDEEDNENSDEYSGEDESENEDSQDDQVNSENSENEEEHESDYG